MNRCLELASLGAGKVAPNPMVGCVIVHNGKIIGEGWHREYGGPHAEVNAIASVKDLSLLPFSTVYVNLEPCSHYGKTPPCADLLILHKVAKVVIGMQDPFEKVSGNGIRKLREAGIETETGVLEEACKTLNKRFITFVTRKRPYIILKWAQTSDGFLAPFKASMSDEEFEQKRHITGLTVQKLVHKWRSEESAILVGTNTIKTDNPALNVRAWKGRNPVRITFDRRLELPRTAKIFDGSQRTIIITEKENASAGISNLEFLQLEFNTGLPASLCSALYEQQIQSLIVEGGAVTLNKFIEAGLWDEAQVFTTPAVLSDGIKAPDISGDISAQTTTGGSLLTIYKNS